jgi:hypothetical protein
MATILSNQWLQKRRPYWDRLGALLGEASAGGVRRLSRAELRETALLYRQAASDVSTLRQDATARAYAEHVNQLLARAHHIIYSSRRIFCAMSTHSSCSARFVMCCWRW